MKKSTLIHCYPDDIATESKAKEYCRGLIFDKIFKNHSEAYAMVIQEWIGGCVLSEKIEVRYNFNEFNELLNENENCGFCITAYYIDKETCTQMFYKSYDKDKYKRLYQAGTVKYSDQMWKRFTDHEIEIRIR